MKEISRIPLDVCTDCLYAINGVDDEPAHDEDVARSEAALAQKFPPRTDGSHWYIMTDVHRDCPESVCSCRSHDDHDDCDDCNCGTIYNDRAACEAEKCGAEDGGFSRYSCDVCDSGLAGGRHKALALLWIGETDHQEG